MILYHGSNVEIGTIDLRLCRPNKDFGRGFYMTDIRNQALRMAERTARIYGGTPVVTAFEFDIEHIGDYEVKLFETPDLEWAKFVMLNRTWTGEGDAHGYDIVIGPVADDAMAVLFRDFERKYINEDDLVRELTFSKAVVTSQYMFRTTESLLLLKKYDK